jgi:hypothetical protein
VRSSKLHELFGEPASLIWQVTKIGELYVRYSKKIFVAKMTQIAGSPGFAGFPGVAGRARL